MPTGSAAFWIAWRPPGYTEELGRLREEINQVWKAFFRGQVVLGMVIGLVVWISMTIVGLPNAGLMGLLAGLLEVIPTFGPVLATIPALLIAFFQGSTYLPMSNFWFAVLVLGIYFVIQQTENAYLVPRIMGRRLQLHPVIVFIGVLAGGMLAGALGVLLAAPIIATIRVVLRYVYAKLLDEDPYPAEVHEKGEIYPGEIDAILFDLDGTLIETDDVAVDDTGPPARANAVVSARSRPGASCTAYPDGSRETGQQLPDPPGPHRPGRQFDGSGGSASAACVASLRRSTFARWTASLRCWQT